MKCSPEYPNSGDGTLLYFFHQKEYKDIHHIRQLPSVVPFHSPFSPILFRHVPELSSDPIQLELSTHP